MNKKQQFYTFLESITDSNNVDLINVVKEAFTITEAGVRGIQFPDVNTREIRNKVTESNKTQQTQQQIQDRNAERLSAQKKNNVISGRVKSHMTNIVSELAKDPTLVMLIEPWMKDSLIPAIKDAKGQKTGVFGKIKGFFGEGVDGELEEENPEFQMTDDDDDAVYDAFREERNQADFDGQDDEVGGVYGGVKRPTVADKAKIKQSRVKY